MTHTVFGIRHHGPGSAHSLRAALKSLQPDLLLVEGPPEADALIGLAADKEMLPPVALLLYAPDTPQVAAYYPFAEFSPEWQAIQYALEKKQPVRFMDLSQRHMLLENWHAVEEKSPLDGGERGSLGDPFTRIAEAVGYSDGERWWEHFVEQRQESGDVFEGILELVAAARAEAEETETGEPSLDLRREAAMRMILRSAQAEGYRNIAVVCGAWHAPVLLHPESFKGDAKLLKGLPETEVVATWVPWTYDRLSLRSGYGAGIESPGWYEHIWRTRHSLVEKWMVKAAQSMRSEGLGISPSHAIEATRLAEALAAMRGRPVPGLPELNEAIQAIFCFGDTTPMRLVHDKLIVGLRMGKVPAETPSVPLQRDLTSVQKRTRLEPSASPELLDLDLRKPLLLERSQLLHCLNVLGIPWGKLQTAHGAKGTFHELWQIEWKPEFAVLVVEASVWGNTVAEAAGNRIEAVARIATDLPSLTRLVESALLANLAESIPGLLTRVQQVAATSGDLPHLMEALPPLVNVLRYGNVRQTDTHLVSQVVDELTQRICIGLSPACSTLDDQAAQEMFEHITSVETAIGILQEESHTRAWTHALELLAAQDEIHGLIRGRASRLLFDHAGMGAETARRMEYALSPGSPPAQAAAWLEGFLHGSSLVLIHKPQFWQMVDSWVMSLTPEMFTALLPLIRRTFSTFPAPERHQIGELAKGGGRAAAAAGDEDLEMARVEKVLPILIRILGAQEDAHA